jgi:aminoglycoside 2''-phosphotransferase
LEQVFADVEGLSFGHVPTLIHGDLAPYHVLHDADTGRVTGVLDFGVAGVGDPAVDLGCLLAVWGERFTGGLARHWPQAAELLARARVLAALMPVEWAVIALETGDPAMAVAHIGHAALDIAPAGTPLGPNL